ncbi:hypothetical protein V6N12_040598 [Hibiscus sabdariffa]|uniref:Uncharacterized protein n=1 Tax=Hibiscus sabdariffa TaxID=183260 RepID=A0ABR2E4S1_9ROSI
MKLTVVADIQSDMINMFILSISFFSPLVMILSAKEEMKLVVRMATTLVLQTIVTTKISLSFFNWVNNKNTERNEFKGSHLLLSMTFIIAIYNSATEGRISKWAINKINYLLVYPLLFL